MKSLTVLIANTVHVRNFLSVNAQDTAKSTIFADVLTTINLLIDGTSKTFE